VPSNLGRQRGRRETLSLDTSSGVDGVASELLTADETGRGLERADLRGVLNEALATLSEAQRRTLVLHAHAGLSDREVAQAMRTSIGTVLSRLYYARQKLRAYLSERALL
jgi:RNA polymerase sigma-70 factor (ECF subfamily)